MKKQENAEWRPLTPALLREMADGVDTYRTGGYKYLAFSYENLAIRLWETADWIDELSCATSVAPAGWWCSRRKGHEGPCAARYSGWNRRDGRDDERTTMTDTPTPPTTPPVLEPAGTTHTYSAQVWYKDPATLFLVASFLALISQESSVLQVVPPQYHALLAAFVTIVNLAIRFQTTLRPVSFTSGATREVVSLPPPVIGTVSDTTRRNL